MSNETDKTPNAARCPQEVLARLRRDGVKSLARVDGSDPSVDKLPEWVDPARLERARQTVLRYLMGIEFSSLTGLLLILQVPDALEPLLTTGNSKDVPSLFKRYLDTVIHVRCWYTDDIFDPQTRGYKSIRQVRAMHRRLQHNMNSKFGVRDLYGQERLWFNHYDVAITQFAFIGLAMAYPEKCAMSRASERELEDINYYWRLLGHMMGLSAEFNSCQLDSYEHIRDLNRLMLEQEFKQKFETQPCKIGLEMTKAICLAMADFLPMVTFNSLAHWWQDCFKFNGYEPQPLTRRERLLVGIQKLSFNKMLRNETVLSVATKLHIKRFEWRAKGRDKIYEKLKSKYAQNTELAFYSDRCDYFAKSAPSGCPLGFAAAN